MYYIWILCVMMTYAQAHDNQTLFEQASAAYHGQHYAEALEQFLQITPTTPSVWYNAGNAAYQQQQYGKALLYWLRATRTGSADIYRASMHNSAYVRAQQGHVFSAYEGLQYYCRYIIRSVPLLILQIVLIMVWIGMFLLWRRKLLHRSILLCISLLSIMILLMTLICAPEKNRAVIVVQQASVYAGPNSSFYQIATLPEAELVTLLCTTEAWDKVSYDGHIGWVQHGQVEPVDQR